MNETELGQLFAVETKTVTTQYKGKKFEFVLKKINGIDGDRITTESKIIKHEKRQEGKELSQDDIKVNIDMEKYNVERIKASVADFIVEDVKHDINKWIKVFPRSLYVWLIKQIDEFNKILSEDDIKNSDKQSVAEKVP